MSKKNLNEILTEEFLRDQYEQKNKSAYQIAREIGCNNKAIYDRLKSFKINRRKGNTYSQIQVGYKQFWITIIEKDGRNKQQLVNWKCECQCGQTFVATTSAIKRGQKSCGCYTRRKRNHRWRGHKDVSLSYYIKLKVEH